jgi:GT2 family glycosyltransferase
VDDASCDASVEIIKKYPCTLIEIKENQGASFARNRGAAASQGQILFFTDSDCVLGSDALSRVWNAFQEHGPGVIIGGTYTPLSYDRGFFSDFQSVFIHHFETKNCNQPDYIPSHALIMDKSSFINSGGFPENFLPILEDVEFCHRMKRAGFKLITEPSIQVGHIFNFTWTRSIRNAFRKSHYWTVYSLRNKDLWNDSGTAARELKINVIISFLSYPLLIIFLFSKLKMIFLILVLGWFVNIYINRFLLKSFRRHGGWLFAFKAFCYYILIYPWPIGIGGVLALFRVFSKRI